MTPGGLRTRTIGRRWLHRVLLLLGTLALLAVPVAAATEPAAIAAPADPARTQGWMTCDPPPDIDMPNRGISGGLDPVSPAQAGSNVVLTGGDKAMDAWSRNGYAGTLWHTYAFSGPCLASGPWVPAENAIANEIFNLAKVLTALTNYTHTFLADDVAKTSPPALREDRGAGAAVFDQIETLVRDMSRHLYLSVYAPYIGLAVLLSSVMLLVYALKGNLAASSKRVLWTFAGMTAATLTYITPLTFLSISDSFVNEAATLESRIVSEYHGGAAFYDPRNSLPMLLYKHTVYEPWLVGEFGAADNAEARDYGAALLKAQACTISEVDTGQCEPPQIEQKQKDWSALAGRIDATQAGSMFSGAAGRISVGFQALITAIAFDLIPLIAKIGVVLALLIIRGLVLAGPIIGVVAVVNNGTLPKVFKALGGALVQALILLVGSSVHVMVLAWITDPARGFTPWTRVLLMLLVTVVLWFSLRPVDRLRQMAAGAVNARVPDPSQLWIARQMRYDRRRRWMRRARGLTRGLSAIGSSGRNSRSSVETATSQAEAPPEPAPPVVRAFADRLRPETTHIRTPLPGGGERGGSGGTPPSSPPPTAPRPPTGPRGPQLPSGGGAAARPDQQPPRPLGGGGPAASPSPDQPGPVPPVFRPGDGAGGARPERSTPPIVALRNRRGIYKVYNPASRLAEGQTPRQSPPGQNGQNPSRGGQGPGYDSARKPPSRPENRSGER